MWVCDSSLFLDEILYQYSDFELGMNGWKSLMGIVSFTYFLFLFPENMVGMVVYQMLIKIIVEKIYFKFSVLM